MKKIILILSFALIGTFVSYSQDLSSPQGGGVLNIESVTPGDGYSKMSFKGDITGYGKVCLLYTSPSPRDKRQSRMPSSA